MKILYFLHAVNAVNSKSETLPGFVCKRVWFSFINLNVTVGCPSNSNAI